MQPRDLVVGEADALPRQIREQVFGAPLGTEQTHVRDGRDQQIGEDRAVVEIVMGHHERVRVARHTHARDGLLGGRAVNARTGEALRPSVGRPRIDELEVPPELQREVRDRHGVGAGAEHDEAKRRMRHLDRDLALGGSEPPRAPAGQGVAERGA